MKLTLVVLAAGMGSRYGGMKQLDRLGPSGETIMDYSVYDALMAGFNKVVFVIRKHFEEEFNQAIVGNIEGKAEVALAFQETDNLPGGFICPPDREKPWGTGHALWVCRDLINEPFAVINADDFYGREAYQTMSDYLKTLNPENPGHYAMCGYKLSNTLSEYGEVSRGICRVDADDMLKRVEEHLAIRKNADGSITSRGKQSDLRDEDVVSMNFWGFNADIFNKTDNKLKVFLENKLHEPKSEFYIPMLVDELISEGHARVQVLSSPAQWFGVTYKEDKARAVEAIKTLVANKTYPARLWH
ncbi:MAG: sugar phosphate nucleotidyltransferase [Bacteroidales bacterium]|nr:sugar phosphate nucleotidyltransferase [Bacteroidales bacterium]